MHPRCRRSRPVRRALGMKTALYPGAALKMGLRMYKSISRRHEYCSPALYAIAQSSGISSGTLVTLVRWLKSVGRPVTPTSPLREFLVASGAWLGAGNCPEPVHQGTTRRIPASDLAALAFRQRGHFRLCNSSNARWTLLQPWSVHALTSMAAAVSVALEAACGCSTTRSAQRADVAQAACGPPYCVPAR
jgi:hypothetical protein